jgi:hypothetical protein
MTAKIVIVCDNPLDLKPPASHLRQCCTTLGENLFIVIEGPLADVGDTVDRLLENYGWRTEKGRHVCPSCSSHLDWIVAYGGVLD